MYDTLKLAKAIMLAADNAKAHSNDHDDGSCNMDFAYLRVPRMSQKTADEIAVLSGVPLRLDTYKWHGRVLKLNIGQGQANRNTAMAEAAYRSLKEQGLDAGMYYQVD